MSTMDTNLQKTQVFVILGARRPLRFHARDGGGRERWYKTEMLQVSGTTEEVLSAMQLHRISQVNR